jgi:glycerophosphoryl diester phosphodiesterase
MAGFRFAAEAGVDYLELDVHLSRDGVLMVIHDEELGRTSDGRGPVGSLSARELMALDVGSWFGARFARERVPTVAGLLAWLEGPSWPGPRPGALLEAKGPGTGARLAGVIAAARIRDRLAICSFSQDELLAARHAAPGVPTMLIVDRDRPGDDAVAGARACGASMVNVPLDWLDVAAVDRLHAAGLFVAGGTVDDEPGIRRAVALGLDAVDSNVPDLAVGFRDATLSGVVG